MLRIDILSAVPNLLDSPFNHSILKRAQERKLLDVHVHDIRAFGVGKHKQIDDIRASGREAASKWKRQKYSRNEGPLPTGPMSARKD